LRTLSITPEVSPHPPRISTFQFRISSFPPRLQPVCLPLLRTLRNSMKTKLL
jgi:hypothetical protein